MIVRNSSFIEKFKDNFFKIFYLILLIVLLTLILSNKGKVNSNAQSKMQNEQLVKEN